MEGESERAEIERRAYRKYEGRGRTDGYDQDDWFEAEREVRAEDARGEESMRRNAARSRVE
ncbi:MAG TPA: DUF2934 domain-containing protein [Vicinamibacterales bacterium]|nr:DUF2934 domain-containing protein [Vicinamibacterales bacterium]